MNITDLIKKAKELELVSKKNLHSLNTGNYVTKIGGKGLQFFEARKYIFGESVKMIDWNMTARFGEPYVKMLHEEREREIIIALDVSPSMYLGYKDKTKIEFAIEVASTLALSTIESKDKLGFILFNDKEVEISKPRSGKIQFFRAIKTFLNYIESPVSKDSTTDIRVVLHSLQKFKKSKFILFILSDFLDADIPEDLKYARVQHDINFLHIFDEVEYLKTDQVFIPSISPEKNNLTYSSGFLNFQNNITIEQKKSELKKITDKHKINTFSISTVSDVGRILKEFFHKKKRVI